MMMGTFVVMSRINLEIVRQRQNLVPHWIIKSIRVAFLKVGSSATTDQKSITSKDTSLRMTYISHTSWRGKTKVWDMIKCGMKVTHSLDYRVRRERSYNYSTVVVRSFSAHPVWTISLRSWQSLFMRNHIATYIEMSIEKSGITFYCIQWHRIRVIIWF